jgi:hypothetical protein
MLERDRRKVGVIQKWLGTTRQFSRSDLHPPRFECTHYRRVVGTIHLGYRLLPVYPLLNETPRKIQSCCALDLIVG